jgi:hypothetical protein
MYRFAGSPVVFGKGSVLHPPSSFPPVFPSHRFSAMSSSGGVGIGGVGVGCRVANRCRRSTVIVSTLSHIASAFLGCSLGNVPHALHAHVHPAPQVAKVHPVRLSDAFRRAIIVSILNGGYIDHTCCRVSPKLELVLAKCVSNSSP